jgi:hypothetical protein
MARHADLLTVHQSGSTGGDDDLISINVLPSTALSGAYGTCLFL